MGRWMGGIRGAICVARGTVHYGEYACGTGECEARIRSPIRQMQMRRGVAADAACDYQELSDLRSERGASASTVGAVWRSICRRVGGDIVEAEVAECAYEWRVCGAGAGGIRDAAEFSYGV